MATEATFPLIEDEPEDTPTVGVGATLVAPLEQRAGFGVGLLTPFRRDKRNDFVSGGDADLLRSKIVQVLGTRADNGRMTGELPWRTDFGSLLYTMRFVNIDEAMAAVVRSRIAGALATWLPQVQVTRVVIRQSDTKIMASLTYNVVQVGTANLLARNQEVDVPL